MKKKKLLVLSLLALSLAGCGSTSNSINSAASVSNAPSTKENSSTPSTTVKPNTDTNLTTDSTSTSTDTTKTDKYENSLWPNSTKDLMVQYLNGYIIPYVNLGTSPSKVYSSWNSYNSILKIMGGTKGELSSILDNAETVYTEYEWSVTKTSEKITAINKDGDITVEVFSDENIFYLTAKYEEVFNPNNASSWSQTLLSNMDYEMYNHGLDIPFVYLGTSNATGSMDNGTYTIIGGNWNDEILNLATRAFDKANVSIKSNSNKWQISSGTNSLGNTFKANVKLADGTKFDITIEAYQLEDEENSESSNTKKIARMVIEYTEPFIIPNDGIWPTAVSDIFDNNFDTHSIPYFYCGTISRNLVLGHYTKKTAYIYGRKGTWNNQVLSLVENALDAENNSIEKESEKWSHNRETSVNTNLIQVVATREFSDGCSLKFTVGNYGSNDNYAEIHIDFNEKYKVPEGADWSDTTKQNFLTYFGDKNIIPYVYLGTTNETCSWNASESTLTITGAEYYESVKKGADSVFSEENGWSNSIKSVETLTGYTYQVTEYSKTINNKVFEIIVDGTSHYTNSTSGNCVMKIKVTAAE